MEAYRERVSQQLTTNRQQGTEAEKATYVSPPGRHALSELGYRQEATRGSFGGVPSASPVATWQVAVVGSQEDCERAVHDQSIGKRRAETLDDHGRVENVGVVRDPTRVLDDKKGRDTLWIWP